MRLIETVLWDTHNICLVEKLRNILGLVTVHISSFLECTCKLAFFLLILKLLFWVLKASFRRLFWVPTAYVWLKHKKTIFRCALFTGGLNTV